MNQMNHMTARTARASALALALGLGCAVSGAAPSTGEGNANGGIRSTTVSPGTPGAMSTTTDGTGISTGTAPGETDRTTRRDRDWGWLGLLGLAGLAGLRGKTDVRDVHDAERNSGRTTPTTR